LGKIDVFNEDIWDAEPINGFVVVTTNVGWKRNGENVMGAGIAKQAAERYPELPKLYGRWCKEKGRNLYLNESLRVICLPTKELNKEQPHLSWKKPSEPRLVLCSYLKLFRLAKEWNNVNCSDERIKYIKCPIFGATNGQIPKNKAIEYAEEFDWPENVKFFERRR